VEIMKEVQRIAIVDPCDQTRDELRSALLGLESVWLEAECSRYEFFGDVIRQSVPDVVIISLDSDPNRAMQLISQIAQDLPQLPILAISARGDGQSILQALRSGAKEFLTSPVVMEELIKALKRLTPAVVSEGPSSNGAHPSRVESLVIAVLGSSGGVGCTSLAVNLGATLAQDEHSTVALVDMDLALGDADVALDLLADYTLADVALNIERLDMTFLKRSLCRHASGLYLLPHPVQVEDAAVIQEDHLQRVISLLRASYTHLILDLSKGFTPADMAALRLSDVILLVAQLELSSLRNIVRILMALNNDFELSEKVQVVLNRVGNDSDITLEKAEETIGRPFYWQVPNEPKLMPESRNHGVPLVTHAPKCKAQLSIAGLSALLTGKEPPAAEKKKARGWGLFSRG
jgi:pilus assembly protein CpaE